MSDQVSVRSHIPMLDAVGQPDVPGFSRSVGRALSVGHLLYLISIGLIATVVAGTFFGMGLSLLAPRTGGAVVNSQPRSSEASSLLRGLLPSINGRHRPVQEGTPGAAPNPGAGAAIIFPLLPIAPAREPVREPASEREVPPAISSGPDATARAATAPLTAPDSSGGPALPSAHIALTQAEIAAFLEHGDALLRIGDLASARLFYERAATAGDGRAALRLGATFDPDFLDRSGLRNLKGDAAAARSWYSRALDLSSAEARRQLDSPETKQGR